MKNLVLIGMPGSGKTTFGRYVAEILRKDFLDADLELEKETGQTIPEIFKVSEDHFRDLETVTVKRLAGTKSGCVLAMGGGVIKRPENIAALKQNGVVIFIDRAPGEIISNVDISGRPLFAGKKERIYNMYAERYKLYQQAADFTVVNDASLKEVLKRILAIAKEQGLATDEKILGS